MCTLYLAALNLRCSSHAPVCLSVFVAHLWENILEKNTRDPTNNQGILLPFRNPTILQPFGNIYFKQGWQLKIVSPNTNNKVMQHHKILRRNKRDLKEQTNIPS